MYLANGTEKVEEDTCQDDIDGRHDGDSGYDSLSAVSSSASSSDRIDLREGVVVFDTQRKEGDKKHGQTTKVDFILPSLTEWCSYNMHAFDEEYKDHELGEGVSNQACPGHTSAQTVATQTLSGNQDRRYHQEEENLDEDDKDQAGHDIALYENSALEFGGPKSCRTC